MISPSGRKLMLSAITTAMIAITADGIASSHREAPHISKYPQVDATDFYMFNSYESDRDDYIVVLANYNPAQAGFAGSNFYTLDNAALYEIHIDNTGNSVEDITFQFQFSNSVPKTGVMRFDIGQENDKKSIPSVIKNTAGITKDAAPGLSYQENYNVKLVKGDRRAGTAQLLTDSSSGSSTFGKPFDYAGVKSFGGAEKYTQYADSFIHTVNVPGCDQKGRVFVGQRLESFKAALGELFDLVNFVPIDADGIPGSGDDDGFPGGVTQNVDRNQLARTNITTIALEIHKDCLIGSGNGVIGGWTTASLPQATILNPTSTLASPEVYGGAWTQVSRLGNPLVNELMIGFSDKDKFNSSEPKDDKQFLNYITHPVLPTIFDTLLKDTINTTLSINISDLSPSNFPRQDMITTFLTGFDQVNQLTTVKNSEILRLNTNIAATPRADQHTLGLIAGDLAGYPNGRRPGDDVVDITLRLVMGGLCYDLPIGIDDTLTNLGICKPEDAPVGNVALTDGAPVSAADFDNTFPYLIMPYPGSPIGASIPIPKN